MWVHGTAAEVENPSALDSNGVFRDGVGSHFFGRSESFNWFHIPIPTPVVIDGARPSLVKVFFLFKLDAGHIKHVDVWNGPFRVRQFDVKLGGNHLEDIDDKNSLAISPPLTISFGLKLALGVQFATLFDPDENAKQDFLIAAAGADFE